MVESWLRSLQSYKKKFKTIAVRSVLKFGDPRVSKSVSGKTQYGLVIHKPLAVMIHSNSHLVVS